MEIVYHAQMNAIRQDKSNALNKVAMEKADIKFMPIKSVEITILILV